MDIYSHVLEHAWGALQEPSQRTENSRSATHTFGALMVMLISANTTPTGRQHWLVLPDRFFPGVLNICLFTPERKLTTDQSNDRTTSQLVSQEFAGVTDRGLAQRPLTETGVAWKQRHHQRAYSTRGDNLQGLSQIYLAVSSPPPTSLLQL